MLVARLVLLTGLAVACATCTPQGHCEVTLPGYDYCNDGVTKDGTMDECNGRIIDPKTWESSPIAEKWIKFPPYRAIKMHLIDRATQKPFASKLFEVHPYIATTPTGTDSVSAAGNLAIISPCTPTPIPCVYLTNETCSTNYLRVVVHGEEIPDAGNAASDATSD